MDWSHATLRLESPTCPAVAEVSEGGRVRCLQRDGAPVAHVTGAELAGWTTLVPCRDGRIARRDAACERCPVRALPAALVPLCVEASREGLRVEVASPGPGPGVLADAYHRLREAGQRPRILRGGRAPGTPGQFVNLDHLSPRQREALDAARRIGYFDVGGGGVDALAAEMACGRSAAHEHLRRGLARLLEALA